MSEVCGDNKFELIGEFKGKLVEGTNIETSPEEMAVLDNVLFRFWQMGWLDKLKAQEPRVLTLEEVKSAWRNRDIAFLVEYNDGGNPVWMLYYGYLSTLEEIVLIDEIAHLRHFDVDGYGIEWRCWTSRPDEKRRAETPWN